MIQESTQLLYYLDLQYQHIWRLLSMPIRRLLSIRNIESSPKELNHDIENRQPEPSALYRLFKELDDLEHCAYSRNGTYYDIDGNALKPIELLTVQRAQPVREFVAVAVLEEEWTRVLYTGENADSMKETVYKLRVPNSWPSNLGEKVFYLFRNELKYLCGPDPVTLEEEVIPGKERQFRLVLKKLTEVYRNSK